MPLKKNTILACLSFIACAASVLAPPRHAGAETLTQAVTAALKTHPTLEAAIASREAASYDKREKFSDLFPKLNVRSAGGRVYGDNSTSRGLSVTRGAGYSDYFEGSVTMSQMIFDGFETYRRLDALEARYKAADQDIVDSRETLAMEVVLTYLDLLRGQETLGMMENHYQTLKATGTKSIRWSKAALPMTQWLCRHGIYKFNSKILWRVPKGRLPRPCLHIVL